MLLLAAIGVGTFALIFAVAYIFMVRSAAAWKAVAEEFGSPMFL